MNAPSKSASRNSSDELDLSKIDSKGLLDGVDALHLLHECKRLRRILSEQGTREAALQAKIDALMLEYCPEEMTPKQTAEWAKHQVPASPEAERQPPPMMCSRCKRTVIFATPGVYAPAERKEASK